MSQAQAQLLIVLNSKIFVQTRQLSLRSLRQAPVVARAQSTFPQLPVGLISSTELRGKGLQIRVLRHG